ncbi:hypothetical protein sce8146 [Sorangium cellulosum So ce56]|uniref:DUF2169 domain-containing protein n=1 Tax=Sorangium cellulosum (strain So ce56) TaxID=448385 RepID=A9FMC4_SORC5|nr:DUF2169 domain-containing protein [Sorangium cellulosum]CAN98316.1 hypothetical protein sce8146 [Sorangium cellulosum So ce56]
MELVNRTGFPAGIFRTVIDDDRLAASVLARITFDVRRGGALTPSEEQSWIVSGPPWESPCGPMDSDEVFYKGGVDVFLFGHARAPGGREVSQMEVKIAVGDWSRTIRVIGDRVWRRSGDQLRPSAPMPFLEMPLTLAHAFGGKDEWDGLSVGYPENEQGKGYYLEEDHAEGGPLPNLEEPDALIAAWTDRPEPVGLGACPITSGQRLRNGLGFDDEGRITELRPTLFNAAFPRMILPGARPGDPVRVDGVLSEGPLAFQIPDAAPRVRLTFGDEVIERPLAIDQIGIEADRYRVFIAYRYPFRYVIHPLQRRRCELFGHPSTVTAKG